MVKISEYKAFTSMEQENKDKQVFTVSKMLESINSVMAPMGGEVELKRRVDESGVAYNTSPQDIHVLDSKARLKATSESIQHLSYHEKLEWIERQKQVGNEYYRQKEFQKASEQYLHALVGLDFGSSHEQAQLVQQQYQLPITCNLAACMLALKKWQQVIQLCSEALKIDPKCTKALRRRGQAYTHLEKFNNARDDFDNALLASESEPQDAADVQNAIGKLHQAEKNTAAAKQRLRKTRKKMMASAAGTLYSDKPERPLFKRNPPTFFGRLSAVVSACWNWILACFSRHSKPSLKSC